MDKQMHAHSSILHPQRIKAKKLSYLVVEVRYKRGEVSRDNSQYGVRLLKRNMVKVWLKLSKSG